MLLKQRISKQVQDGVTMLQDLPLKSVEGLQYTGMRVLEIHEGASYGEKTTNFEVCVVALTGKISVADIESDLGILGKRNDIFEKIPTDSVYIGINNRFDITAQSNAKVLIAYAPAKKELPTKVILSEDNLVEHRGKYNNKRLVHNILDDQSTIAESLLVVEVFTDEANWSSYPPHKHDKDNLPEESLLEEIYYHEMNPKQGFVFQRVYTDKLDIDETMTVKNGDAVVVPRGYHPVGVPDGYDSFYLNVMAGPTKIWKFNNDKDHEWILDRSE
ncbi:5-deoxy-glucuronate isomerase [Companilactobacillus jidongensis]|uniref:5-deoxy-glucuronate isomerase n=1 Tax=Companilactobacillus jidongensis TaxID=2486006 RepID=UPI000F7B5CB5|nr:5-deoxy-glucuronate isomerase [Companilactobacillus jidongensis]